MEYNPYTQEYNRLKHVLENRNSEKRRLSDELDWFNSTDISSLYFSLDEKEQAKTKIQSLITNIEKEIEVLHTKIQETKSYTKTLFNPFNWFDDEQKIYRKTLNRLKKELYSKEENNRLKATSLSEINESINKYKKEIDKYKNFNKKKTSDKVKSLSQDIVLLEAEIKQVYELKNNVDIKLQPILSQIEDCESNISTAKGKISKAQSFERNLDYADNSYERAMVHEECERVLGDGSPKKIIRKQYK